MFVLLLLTVGCIAVDDFGAYWNKGFIDNCVNEIVLNQQDSGRPMSRNSKSMLLRSLRIGNHTFLMMRDDARKKGGNMILYSIDGEDYVSYRLNESRRDEFLEDYPNSGVIVTSETATIPVLNESSVKLVSEIADDEGYWVESHRELYNPRHRDDCVQALY